MSGQIYAQPLYVAAAIGGKNALFVATEENRVYAFHADPPWEPLWSGGVRNLETAWSPASFNCSNSIKPFGINSTPVIDPGSSPPATATLYVVTKSLPSGVPKYFLHALNLNDGTDRSPPIDMGLDASGNPVSVAGTGLGSAGGRLVFDPMIHQNRVALTLSGGVLSAGFGSYCDHDNYHGWILRFDTTRSPMVPLAPFVTTPNNSRGAVWMGGAGLSADAAGALYFTTGNGPASGTDTSGASLGNAFVKLTGSLTQPPAVASWFMPSDVVAQDVADTDVGSAGPLLIPGTPLILGGGKNGIFYLLNKDSMGGFKAGAIPETPPQVVQRFAASSGNWIVGSPIWWDGGSGPRMYVWPGKTPLQAYAFDRSLGTNGMFNTTPIELGSDNPQNDPQGGQLSLSANGTGAASAGTGIVWATHATQSPGDGTAKPGVLYAYSADHVSMKLWDSSLRAQDNLASFSKYTPPTVADGKVFVATFSGKVEVFGLLSGSTDGGARDAGVVADARVDAPPPLLTCATVDGGAAQPTSWSYVYNTYFAGPADGGATTAGHCAACHGSFARLNFLSGFNKDDCYKGLVTVGQVTPDAGASSPIADPSRSALSWFGDRTPGTGILEFMPQDLKARNPRAVAAVCGWVKAGAVNDKAIGQPCGAAGQCTSGACVDGFCCNSACGASCTACSAARTGGANGTCAAMLIGSADTRCGSAPPCGNSGLCAAGDVCQIAPPTTSCRAASCAAGVATMAASCTGTGAGACPAVATVSCGAFVCGTSACKTSCAADTDCVAGDFCSGTSCVIKRATGAACTAANQCASASCVDGFCCNSACGASCMACSAARTGGANGTCAAMTTGSADTRCGSAPPCGNTGLCAAGGVCQIAPPTTSCRAASCAGGVATMAASCTGAGACPAPVTKTCAPFICGATACTTSCSTSAACAPGLQCTGGLCVGCPGGVCKSNGATCAAGSECVSGACVDGFCCNSACSGSCTACSAAKTGGASGTCAAMIGGSADSRCGSAPPCGNTGLCAAGGVCQIAPATTSCRPASCAGGLATLAASCTGTGTGACPAPVTVSCGLFVCGAGACKTSCAADSDCAPGDFCSGTVCVAKKAAGAACAADQECAGGSCSTDGVCCSTSCKLACQACASAHTGLAAGICGPTLTPSGTNVCNNACVNTLTDAANCGGCGHACAAGAACASGACSAAACSAATALIDDFEDGNNQVSLLDGRTGPLYTYVDTIGSTVSPGAGSIFAPAAGGNGTSARAAHVSGHLAGSGTVWAGMGMDLLTPKALYNGAKYTGISFFAKKGSSAASGALRVKVPDRDTDPTGAICTVCSNDFGSDITLNTAWTKYTIPFSAMTQQAGWGAPRPAAIDPTGLVAVQFQVTAAGATYDIWIDDVTFNCN